MSNEQCITYNAKCLMEEKELENYNNESSSIKKSLLHIFHYSLFILLFLLFIFISACSSSTSTQKGSLSGIINLEDSEDNSGITVAVYDLAYLSSFECLVFNA